MTSNSLVSVIDDDPSMCRMLARGIQAAGFDVEVFNSAEEFLSSGKLEESSCLILDIDLPGMTGIELHQQLTESETLIPVIFISGHADQETGNRALDAGAAKFFNKPFSIDSLVNTIQTIHSS